MSEDNGIGHNSGNTGDEPAVLSDKQLKAIGYHHKGLYERALAAKKKADAALKNCAKEALAAGVSVADIKTLIQLDTPEGEAAIRADLERQLKTLRWSGSELGTQLSFLDEPDRTPIEDRAYLEGETAGMKGETPRAPYEGAAEQAWLRGHHDGQEVLMGTLELTKAGITQIKKERKAKAASDAAPKKRGQKRKNGSYSEKLAEHNAAVDEQLKGGDPFPEEAAA